jgi:hypothetical protein
MSRRHALVPLTMLAALLASSGCRFPFSRAEPVQHQTLSFHTTAQAAELHRVAVLPFFLAENVGRSAGAINEAMASALRELGLHEALSVSVAQRDLLLPHDVLLSNRISVDDLLKLRDELHCDAVLIGRVEHFTGFDPLAIGVSAHLVSCLDGSIAWSATAHIDSRRADVQRDIELWYERTAGEGNAGITGWKQTLESPRLFTRFVAEQLTLSIPVPIAKK